MQHIAIKTGNHKNNVKYNRFSWVFCLYIKLYAYICNVFFMVLELRLTKIGCRDDNQFFILNCSVFHLYFLSYTIQDTP